MSFYCFDMISGLQVIEIGNDCVTLQFCVSAVVRRYQVSRARLINSKYIVLAKQLPTPFKNIWLYQRLNKWNFLDNRIIFSYKSTLSWVQILSKLLYRSVLDENLDITYERNNGLSFTSNHSIWCCKCFVLEMYLI